MILYISPPPSLPVLALCPASCNDDALLFCSPCSLKRKRKEYETSNEGKECIYLSAVRLALSYALLYVGACQAELLACYVTPPAEFGSRFVPFGSEARRNCAWIIHFYQLILHFSTNITPLPSKLLYVTSNRRLPEDDNHQTTFSSKQKYSSLLRQLNMHPSSYSMARWDEATNA
jgi:hypothetical protein